VNARAQKPSAVPEHEQVFDDWATPLIEKWHEGDGRTRKDGTLSPASAAHYRYVWLAWCEWLGGQTAKRSQAGTPRWRTATPQEVTAFLTNPPPRKTRATKIGRRASFSRRSYWHILAGVYAHAALAQLIAESPLIHVPKPGVDSAARAPQCVDPAVLAMIRKPRSLLQLVPDTQPTWLAARDRAAIALVAHCAPTAAELRALKQQDLRLPEPQQPLEGMSAKPDGELDLPGRTLKVPASIVPLLRDWLAEREEAILSASSKPAATARTLHRLPLFLGREGWSVDGASVPPGLSAPTTHMIFARAIEKAHEKLLASGQQQPGTYNAKGPASVRNSVIRGWALDHGAGTAALWSGLKRVTGRYL